MNHEMALEIVRKIAHNHIPSNARKFNFRYLDATAPGRNMLGCFSDIKPFEGKVVEQEEGLLIVKEGRTTLSGVRLDQVDGDIPKIGTKVKVVPYARQDFTGRKLYEPKVSVKTASDGTQFEVKSYELGVGRVDLPTQAPDCQELQELIEQLSVLDAPGSCGYRKITHMLADAKASDFVVINPKPGVAPEINFHVATTRYTGRVAIRYHHGLDLCSVVYSVGVYGGQDYGTCTVEKVYFDILGDVLAGIFDDESWKRIKVTPVTKTRADTRTLNS